MTIASGHKTQASHAQRLSSRFAKLGAGLLLMAFGVVCTAKADLGISPIASVPYVMALSVPLSLGLWTTIFSLFLLLVQLLLYRFRIPVISLLQLPAAVVFGLFTDGAMALLDSISPKTLPAQVLFLITGCILLSFGVHLETSASLAMLPGEATAQAVAVSAKRSFGAAKILTDLGMVLSAGLLSVLLLGRLRGIGVGTVVAAISVGSLCKLLSRLSSQKAPT